MKIIDPHLHFFALNEGSYDWLKPGNAPFWPDKNIIARSFNQQDVKLIPPFSLAGFVHIEAGFDNQQPWREIAWLEDNVQGAFRAIATLDITLPKLEFIRQLSILKQYKSFVGIRHILDEHAETILTHSNSLPNLAVLAKEQLIFEIQMPLSNTNSVDVLSKLLKNLPQLRCSLNHAGWPPKNIDESSNWYKNIQHLACFENVFIKCSGFEMINRQYAPQWQHWVIATACQFFGHSRTMLASNFPLSIWHSTYQKTWKNYTNLNVFSTRLSENNVFEQLLFENAYKFYKF